MLTNQKDKRIPDLTGAQLTALRTHLNIPVTVAIDFIDDAASKRAWYYYEKGRNPVPKGITASLLKLLQRRNEVFESFLEGRYHIGQFKCLDDLKASVSTTDDISWCLHQSAEAEYTAKVLSGAVVAPEGAPCRATAVYHNGHNNYQTNYTGTLQQIKKNFVDEMCHRSVVWATLHREADGALISTYSQDDNSLGGQ